MKKSLLKKLCISFAVKYTYYIPEHFHTQIHASHTDKKKKNIHKRKKSISRHC